MMNRAELIVAGRDQLVKGTRFLHAPQGADLSRYIANHYEQILTPSQFSAAQDYHSGALFKVEPHRRADLFFNYLYALPVMRKAIDQGFNQFRTTEKRSSRGDFEDIDFGLHLDLCKGNYRFMHNIWAIQPFLQQFARAIHRRIPGQPLPQSLENLISAVDRNYGYDYHLEFYPQELLRRPMKLIAFLASTRLNMDTTKYEPWRDERVMARQGLGIWNVKRERRYNVSQTSMVHVGSIEQVPNPKAEKDGEKSTKSVVKKEEETNEFNLLSITMATPVRVPAKFVVGGVKDMKMIETRDILIPWVHRGIRTIVGAQTTYQTERAQGVLLDYNDKIRSRGVSQANLDVGLDILVSFYQLFNESTFFYTMDDFVKRRPAR